MDTNEDSLKRLVDKQMVVMDKLNDQRKVLLVALRYALGQCPYCHGGSNSDCESCQPLRNAIDKGEK